METKKRRSKVVVLKAVSGVKASHHQLELSDDQSDTSLTSGTEAMTSLQGTDHQNSQQSLTNQVLHSTPRSKKSVFKSSSNGSSTLRLPHLSVKNNVSQLNILPPSSSSSEEEHDYASDPVKPRKPPFSPKRNRIGTRSSSSSNSLLHPTRVSKTRPSTSPSILSTPKNKSTKIPNSDFHLKWPPQSMSSFDSPSHRGLNQIHPKTVDPAPMALFPSKSAPPVTDLAPLSGSRSPLSGTGLVTPLLTVNLRQRGSKAFTESLWADNQLKSCFPDRHIRVSVVTWNMQERKELPKFLDDLLLPLNHSHAADMFVIGTQESTPSRREWEVLIQQTLGPSYVLVKSSSIGVIYLNLFIRRDLIWFCSAIHSSTFSTRPVTTIKTKGAVGISFTLFGSSFLFITSHFTANKDKVAERNSDMQRIAASLTVSNDASTENSIEGDVTTQFDYVFWFGDLNYRVKLSRRAADEFLATNDWMSLLLKDQLTAEILQGNVFHGYSEQPIFFPPSYKFDLFSDQYDSSEKQRVPSWTDRILFKSRKGSGIYGCGYFCCGSLKCSDHRPVCALFRVKLEPSLHTDGIPDTVAGFDKEIFIRANKQRKVLAEQLASTASDEVDSRGSSSTGPTRTKAANRKVQSQVCLIL